MNPDLKHLCSGLPISPLAENNKRSPNIAHASKRNINLNETERELAIRNALRYFPSEHHSLLAREFSEELDLYGHIYMYRFLPTIRMK